MVKGGRTSPYLLFLLLLLLPLFLLSLFLSFVEIRSSERGQDRIKVGNTIMGAGNGNRHKDGVRDLGLEFWNWVLELENRHWMNHGWRKIPWIPQPHPLGLRPCMFSLLHGANTPLYFEALRPVSSGPEWPGISRSGFRRTTGSHLNVDETHRDSGKVMYLLYVVRVSQTCLHVNIPVELPCKPSCRRRALHPNQSQVMIRQSIIE